MTMDQNSFLLAVRATPRTWHFVPPHNAIRCRVSIRSGEETVCPLTAVAYQQHHIFHRTAMYRLAASDLGIDEAVTQLITGAADNSRKNSEIVAYRKRLLKACRLPAETPTAS